MPGDDTSKGVLSRDRIFNVHYATDLFTDGGAVINGDARRVIDIYPHHTVAPLGQILCTPEFVTHRGDRGFQQLHNLLTLASHRRSVPPCTKKPLKRGFLNLALPGHNTDNADW